METLNPGFEKVILICLNERTDGRECCRARGSEKVHAALKGWVKEHGLSGRIRVSKSGCLDQCARGTTVLVLPDYCWYGGVTLEDVDRIIAEHLAAMLPLPSETLKESS
jgi:(2Fe-2S) ferredoxin